MESETPSSQTEEIKVGTHEKISTAAQKDSGQTGVGAVIVQMPDSNCHYGLRAWVDRREVEEMVSREVLGRKKKHSFVQSIPYVEKPNKVTLKEGMELYFVGHGGSSGFIGNRLGHGAEYIGEKHLCEWIKQRRDRNEVIRLEKIKLVTCNSANAGNGGAFAERLATALKGIVKGRVVGFNQYLLSAPEVKATYAREPLSAWVDVSLDEDLRSLVFAGLFADLLLTTDKKHLSTTAVQWARQVLCRDPAKLDSLAEMYIPANKAKPPVDKKTLSKQLADKKKHWIAWPKRNVEDLETMVTEMERKNATAVQPPEVGDAKKAPLDATEKNWAQCKSEALQVFTKMRGYILQLAREEWDKRKLKLIDAFDHKETPSVRKTPGSRIASRQEFIIPS